MTEHGLLFLRGLRLTFCSGRIEESDGEGGVGIKLEDDEVGMIEWAEMAKPESDGEDCGETILVEKGFESLSTGTFMHWPAMRGFETIAAWEMRVACAYS